MCGAASTLWVYEPLPVFTPGLQILFSWPPRTVQRSHQAKQTEKQQPGRNNEAEESLLKPLRHLITMRSLITVNR